jgi:hypothetical protein
MPWIDSVPPAKPLVKKSKGDSFHISYKGNKKIKAYAIFALTPFVDEKLEYSSLIQIIQSSGDASFNRDGSIAPADNRLFVASVDVNNNISEWVELK